MIERPFEKQPQPSAHQKAVQHDAQQLETSAENFLRTGNESFSNEFQRELQSMAAKGPDYMREVFKQASADSDKSHVKVSDSGDQITFDHESIYSKYDKHITGTIAGSMTEAVNNSPIGLPAIGFRENNGRN